MDPGWEAEPILQDDDRTVRHVPGSQVLRFVMMMMIMMVMMMMMMMRLVQVTRRHPPVHRRGARQPGHQHHQPKARPAGARGCNKIHTYMGNTILSIVNTVMSLLSS